LLVTGHWLLVAGCWSLVAGQWLLVAGCWSLVAGHWLLVSGCWSLFAEGEITGLFFVKFLFPRPLHSQ
jgi:hypothetical protein